MDLNIVHIKVFYLTFIDVFFLFLSRFITLFNVFTATCFSNVAVMGSLDVRLSVCPSVRNVGDS